MTFKIPKMELEDEWLQASRNPQNYFNDYYKHCVGENVCFRGFLWLYQTAEEAGNERTKRVQ